MKTFVTYEIYYNKRFNEKAHITLVVMMNIANITENSEHKFRYFVSNKVLST